MTNRMPPTETADWRTWTPHEALAPEFNRELRDGVTVTQETSGISAAPTGT
ncbi:hypothetical protein ACFSR7_17130 [Cohnella sp. GCM10020058]|uniref:hypothetical protein n=1 Tax=Cohnella sp. GCM10020058 TaxID=3317330 RepID=UPI0036252152